jgi:hypothetical protein
MTELYTSEDERKAAPAKKEQKREFIPRHKGSSLSSLLVLPRKNIHFETQEPEEEILLILRKHWLTNIPWFLLGLTLFFAPLVLTFFPLLDSFPPRFQFIFVVFWYLVLLMFVYEQFLSWFFNLSIITDERIIDVDFINLTSKKISDAELDKIQDVTFTNNGVFGTIFNYGDVIVQTAAEMPEFVFEAVPQPASVANILQRLRTEEKIEALEGRIR